MFPPLPSPPQKPRPLREKRGKHDKTHYSQLQKPYWWTLFSIQRDSFIRVTLIVTSLVTGSALEEQEVRAATTTSLQRARDINCVFKDISESIH
jgi:hypothetical protein